MKQSFSLRYTGEALHSGMDAEDVASAIQGIAGMARQAAAMVSGDAARIEFRLRGAKSGSLSISFLLEILGAAQTLLPIVGGNAASADSVFTSIKTWFELLKHLGGEPPKTTQTVNNGSAVQVQNMSGDSKIVNINIYNSFNNADIGRYAESLGRPLGRGKKASSLEVKVGRKRAASLGRSDVPSLKSISTSKNQLVQRSTVLLKIVSLVLEGDGKWKFKSGKNTISAKIEDARFLGAVRSGQEAFRAGDFLEVRLRSVQERIGDDIQDHHFIEEVLSHDRPSEFAQSRIL